MSNFSNATFYLTPSGYKEGFIFQQKPLSTIGDVSFTRATNAWRTTIDGQIEETPYNLLSYSEDYSNAVWTSGISGTGVLPVKSYNTVIAPNGTLTADTIVFDRGTGNTISDVSVIQQFYTDTVAPTYTFSIWVKASTVSDIGKQIFLRIGNAGGLFPTTLTSNWSRISITQTNTITAGGSYVQFGNRGTVTSGNSVSVDVWGAQVVRGSSLKNYLTTTNRQNFPRVDYSTGYGNLLLEPQRTNSIRNSTMVGASVSGNTLPTNWGVVNSAGLTWTVVGLGSERGLNYVDIRVSGTHTLVNQDRLYFEPNFIISASSGQTFSETIYFKIISAPSPPADYRLRFVERSSGGTLQNTAEQVFTPNFTSLDRFNFTYTILSSATTMINPELAFLTTINNSYDFTVRIAAPQTELGAYPTTFISTSTVSVTRLVDTFSYNNIYTNGLISSSGGTWFIQLKNNISYVRDNYGGITFDTVLGGFTDGFTIRNGTPQPASYTLSLQIFKATVNQGSYGLTSSSPKIILKWNGTTCDVFVDGVKIASALSFTATQLQYLNNTNPQGVPLNIQQMALWNTPLTDAQCIQLTS
jgi:hypothetical protein